MTSRGNRSRTFWSNGYASGTILQVPGEAGIEADLTVLEGKLQIRRLVFTDFGSVELPVSETIEAGQSHRLRIQRA